MIQGVFFILFVLAILAGFFAYFAPLQKPIHPLETIMDTLGYTSERDRNRAKTEEINVLVNKGVMEIHRRVEDLGVQQSQMFQALRDQQQVLSDSRRRIGDMMLMTQNNQQFGSDILQLKNLASQMEDDQQLMISKGKSLVELNDELTAQRELLAERLEWNNINAQTSLQDMKDQYEALKNQVSSFCDKARQYNQQVEDKIANMQAKIAEISNKARDNNQKQQGIRDHLSSLLESEREQMERLTQEQDKERQDAQDARDREEDSQATLNSELQQSQDTMDNDRQKALDEQDQVHQQIIDQEQRMQDERAQQNL